MNDPSWSEDEERMVMLIALNTPLPTDYHPCRGCGCWVVANNTIQHWREDCTEYPQESECR